MANWTFEPGHTSAVFSARHMMVTHVRGHFKNVNGTLSFDPQNPDKSAVDVTINAADLWSGDQYRDDHLKNADFLDAENHPQITFKSTKVEVLSANSANITGDLTIRGVTKPTTLEASYLGQWDTPWWEDGEDKGPKLRAGFTATARINRHDFGVSWNGTLDKGGVVVGDYVDITLDAEAILDD